MGTGIIQTTHEIGERRYVSNKGTRYEITPEGGLFAIRMKRGGKAPPICDQRYTTYQTAERALETYLKATDRMGYAIYPSKENHAKS